MSKNLKNLIDIDLLSLFKSKLDLLLANKVDKENGKVLSSNDYTADEKAKLANIATGAQVNTLEGIQVAGATINPVNKIANIPAVTQSAEGVMTAADKQRLDNLANEHSIFTGVVTSSNNTLSFTPGQDLTVDALVSSINEGKIPIIRATYDDGIVGRIINFVCGDSDIVQVQNTSNGLYTVSIVFNSKVLETAYYQNYKIDESLSFVLNYELRLEKDYNGLPKWTIDRYADLDYVEMESFVQDKMSEVYGTFENYYTQAQIDQMLVGAMNYKGTKATVSALPASGNSQGDVWHVNADGSEWAWNGSTWEELGTAVDLSGYVEESEIGLASNDDIDAMFPSGNSND